MNPSSTCLSEGYQKLDEPDNEGLQVSSRALAELTRILQTRSRVKIREKKKRANLFAFSKRNSHSYE